MTDKKSLRKEIIQKRAAIAPDEVARRTCAMRAHLERWLSLQPKSAVCLYSPIRNEPDLTGLIDSLPQVSFALPVVLNATQMEFYIVDNNTTFVANKWGILEPERREKICQLDEKVLVVIPAVAADVNGYRLGYGAGYYDRHLQHSKATHMLAVYSEFVLKTLPRDDHDIKAHFILTEGGVGEC